MKAPLSVAFEFRPFILAGVGKYHFHVMVDDEPDYQGSFAIGQTQTPIH
jgi:hypothetical protein